MKISSELLRKRTFAGLLAALLVLCAIPQIYIETAYAIELGAVDEDPDVESGSDASGTDNPDVDEAVDSEEDKTFYSLSEEGTYTVTITGTPEMGGVVGVSDSREETAADGENIPEGESRTVYAIPSEGYEISDITATKDGEPWLAENQGKGWLFYVNSDTGEFSYEITSIENDIAFEVLFVKQTFMLTYTLDSNGELILNSGNASVQIEISGSAEGEQEIEYTEHAYMITAKVTDSDKYHISSFLVDGREQVKSFSNDTNEVSYIFDDGIKEEHQIVLMIERDTCKISVAISGDGNGHVDLADGTEINGEIFANVGEDITVAIKPDSENQIASIVVDEKELTVDDCMKQSDGSYQYTISAVDKDITLTVTFAAILSEIKSLEDSGLIISDGINELKADENGSYYARQIIVSKSGSLLSLSPEDDYTQEISWLTDGIYNLGKVYLMPEGNTTFGMESRLVVTPEVALVVDRTAPEVVLDDEDNILWTDEKTDSIKITGRVSDSNFQCLVYSEDGHLTAEQILGEDNKVSIGNGRFTCSVNFPVDRSEQIYYFYALDKAGNIGVCTLKLYRDKTKPVVNAITVSNDTLTKRSDGNYGNNALILNVIAADVINNDYASGIAVVRVYAGETEIDSKKVQSPIVGDRPTSISVTIPVGGAFAQLQELRVRVEDQQGNISDAYTFTNPGTDGFLSDKLMLEQDAPVATLICPVDGRYVRQNGEVQEFWYREVPEIGYRGTDGTGSGFAERHIELNNSLLPKYSLDYKDGARVYDDSGIIAAEDLAAGDGENEITLWYQDLSGNIGEISQKLYLDTHAPQITEFNLTVTSGSILPFGNSEGSLAIITVTVDDVNGEDGQVYATAGIDRVVLYINGNAYLTGRVNAQNQAELRLPAEAVLDGQEKALDCSVSAIVYDCVGNKSVRFDMTTENSNIQNDHLMIENVKPVINVILNSQGYRGSNGIVYNNGDTEFSLSVSDINSGLRSVRIALNDTVLVDERFDNGDEAITSTQSYVVSTANATTTEEGMYVLSVTVVDNAGNVNEIHEHVCKDETAPQITRFEMQAAGNRDADGSVLSISEMDYGYYFIENTLVTIYAVDGTGDGGSGVKEICYYTVGADGTKSSVTTARVDTQQNAVSFTLPAGFKGQIYACAYDWVGNGMDQYVTPSGLIIETAEQHAREPHISYQKADAPYVDMDGEELYASDVTVQITVMDTFSGIRSVEWFVAAPNDAGHNQQGSLEIDNNGEFMAGSDTAGWNQTRTQSNLVTELQRNLSVSNDSNSITVHVSMTDRAGHTSEEEIVFGIDKTVPIIEVAFDDGTADAEYTEMYRQDRVATITVHERNFDPNGITAQITNTDGSIPTISGWQVSENPDETISTATITFSDDGDYTMEVSGVDLANNPAEVVRVDDFTIDKTAPVIAVFYDTDNALNGNYFATERTATIQIEEHNFSAERVEITGTVTDGGAELTFPAASAWSDAGDIHTATIFCGTDGLYRFDVSYSDMAGNEAEMFTGEEYYVDMTEPEIEISGVEDMSANNGDVIPIIAMSDTNYDVNGVNIEISGANRGTVLPEGSYTAQAQGQIFTFSDFPHEQSYDDIYTLTATLTDMAGNESTDTITFSVNRFGSVYVFDDSLKAIAGSYIQEEIDVRLTEVNVDSLEHDKIRVVVDTNGTPRDLIEGRDYFVQESGGNGRWHQYDYTINKSLFAGDGRYIITLYSEDIAGNVNENIDDVKEAEISFGVDKTAPVVIPIDIETDGQYAVDVKNAMVTVSDNLILKEVQVYVDEEPCEYIMDGENYSFVVPSATERQDVRIMATDAAGNQTNYIISGVLVTTNTFIRWYNNTPLFVGTIVGAAVVSGAGAVLVVMSRRGRVRLKK